MQVRTGAQQLLFATVRIETDRGVGTGFLVQHQWGDDARGIFLITNQHVIKGGTTAQLFFTREVDGEPAIGDRVGVTWEGFAVPWVVSPDGQDVAVAPVAELLEKMRAEGRKAFIRPIPTTMIPTEQQLGEDLNAVEEVLFIGYPSGIFDSVNLTPVVRKGITATPPQLDYCGEPKFLIDASVFPGSSGSPVVVLNEGMFHLPGGNTVVGSRFFLLGLVSEVLVRLDNGDLDFVDVPTAMTPVVRTTQMIDLGVVIKASAILETIDALLKKHGEI